MSGERWIVVLLSALALTACSVVGPESASPYAGPVARGSVASWDELWIVPVQRNEQSFPLAGVAAPERIDAELRDGGGAARSPERASLDAEIVGRLASVRIVQRYARVDGDALYVLRLPPGAAITDFVLVIGERRIRGVVRERADAARLFRLAARQGHRAALLTEETPGVFAQRVGGLAGGPLDVELEYAQGVPLANGWCELELPDLGTESAVAVALDALAPIDELGAPDGVAVEREGAERARIVGRTAGRFALRYRVDADARPPVLVTGGHAALVRYGDGELDWRGLSVRELEREHMGVATVVGGSAAPGATREVTGRAARALGMLWARARIAELAREALTAEGEELDATLGELRDVALAQGLVTPLTAYQVVDATR